ncbi:MAG: CoA pyrophosphatase [Chitinophagaceae bacterium]|nr:CoA pyrophosphatase [Chitinophagaceae bacterium]
MQFQSFIKKLQQQLSQPLPGETAQFKMAPGRRITMEEYDQLANKNPRPSAVLICLFPYQENIYTLLMLRPEEQGAHSGQVSFPGGRFETADNDLQTTALREAQEETGMDQRKVEILGALTRLFIPVSNSMVQPYLGYLNEKPLLKKNDAEVKEIIETDIRLIMNPSLKENAIFKGINNFQIEAPYYNIQGHKVWGATAMMLSELEALLVKVTFNADQMQ